MQSVKSLSGIGGSVRSGLFVVATLIVVGCGAQSDVVVDELDESLIPRATAQDTTRRQTGRPLAAVPKSSGRAGEQWSEFRGPTGMGTSTATGLPVEWSAERNIVWKTPLPGPGASSPIVFAERIYLTCYTGYYIPDRPGGSLEDLERHLLAIDKNSGKVLWDRAVKAKLPEEEQIRDHGYAANTPVADDAAVYVFFGKSGVIAFDHDGKQLWQADVGDRTNGWGTAASPVLHGDLLIINASVESGSLIALNRRDGRQVWKAGGINEAWNTPLVVQTKSGRPEVIVATHGEIKSFAPETGQPLWTCKTDITWYMVPSVVAHDDVIYCLGGRSGISSLAVRAGGSGDVTQSHRLWTSMKGSNVSSPVFLDGHLYWMSDQRGTAYCAKADSGDIVYEERLDRAGQVYSSALLADGKIYYLTREGRTFVLQASPTFKQLAANDLGDRSLFNGSPAVDGNRLLIRSDKFLYCIGEK